MIKIGDIVIPMRNSNGHNYTFGRKYRIIEPINDYTFLAEDIETSWVGNHLMITDCELNKLNKKEIIKSINKLEEELDKYNKMINFIIDTKKESIVVNEFITWYLLKIMNSDDKDKFSKISKILNTISNNISVDLVSHV